MLKDSESKPKQQDEPLKVMHTFGGSLLRSPVMPSDGCVSRHCIPWARPLPAIFFLVSMSNFTSVPATLTTV